MSNNDPNPSFPWIECKRHGKQPPAFVCQHLNGGSKKGFFIPEGVTDEAWCAKCDEFVARQGGWTSKAIRRANMQLVCKPCFELIRQANSYTFGRLSLLQ